MAPWLKSGLRLSRHLNGTYEKRCSATLDTLPDYLYELLFVVFYCQRSFRGQVEDFIQDFTNFITLLMHTKLQKLRNYFRWTNRKLTWIKFQVSDGDVIRGEYRVQLPDGRLQIVKYTADWKNGFNADVSYQGEAQYPEASNNQNSNAPYPAAGANRPSNSYGPPSSSGSAPVSSYGPPQSGY